MILHLDADAFFAAVEQAADARLRGRPVAVGGERRGVIASASYEARRFGVTGAMPTARARKLCPKLIVLPPDFEKYELFSRRMFCYAHDFTPLVEVGSIDEGYLDLSGCRQQSPREIAQAIQRAVGQSLKITISEGLAANKLVSQIASKLHKPAGFHEVPRGEECAFLHPLPSFWLPGVGPKLASTFRAAGLATIGQVAEMPPDMLAMLAGGSAARMRAQANGQDDRPVIPDAPAAKSYGIQETFAEDVTDEAYLLAKLRVMADTLMSRVRGEGKAIRGISLRLRYNDMSECQRSESLSEPVALEHEVYAMLPRLLTRAWERRVSVRLLALRFSQVYQGAITRELPLIGLPVSDDKRFRLAGVIDGLRGARLSVMRGHDLWLRQQGGKPRPSLVASTVARTAKEPSANRVLRERPSTSASTKSAGTLAALNIKSCYSFLDSTLSIPAIMETALARGFSAVALTDPNLHAAVPFFQAAQAAGLKPIIGAELRRGPDRLNAYVENARGFENLCRLLSLRAEAKVKEAELREHSEGLIILPADSPGLPEIRYAAPTDRLRYDIVQSIRTLTLLREPHPAKRKGDFSFPDAAEMRERFSGQDLRLLAEIAERCEFAFDFQTLRFPRWRPPDGTSPAAFLRRLAEEGLAKRYSAKAKQHRAQLHEELGIIQEVGYEEYFLFVWDLLMQCRERGIDWITRGSAADSLVCYCLEISGVCPIRFDLYFKRFLNRERMALQKLPDIDVDFAHDRKDEVVNLLLERHGAEHAAVVGGFSTFQARSAVAEIAKVLGVAEREIRALTTKLPHARAEYLPEAIAANHLAKDFPIEAEPYRTAIATAVFLDGFPRYPKMHPCGVIVARDPIRSLTPTFVSQKAWPTTHFDMEAVEAVGLIKLDILAQGGLAVLRDATGMLAERGVAVDLESLEPWKEEAVWDMIEHGESRGVHHIESPAMCGLARMARVRDIDRLIAIVSVIRPGAANNLKKRQFSMRAQGLEPVTYPHPSLEPVLRSTFGVVAYEEHILQICEAFAGISPGRADLLRRALVKQDQRKIEEIGLEFVRSALALERTEGEIREVWELVAGFQGYAFCRAHSTAYGVEAYQGAFLKRHYPAEFLAAVLSNGKGFYSPLAYTLECRRLGFGFRLPCVNASRAGYWVEREDGQTYLRLPISAIKSLTEVTHARYLTQRKQGTFDSLADFTRRVSPKPTETLALIRAGSFDGFGHSRPAQFWQARKLGFWPASEAWLFPPEADISSLPSSLAEPDRLSRLREEVELFGFPVSAHPLDLHPDIAWAAYCPIREVAKFPEQRVTICGLIMEERLHRQSTGEIMKFLTLCDYTGFAECEVFAEAYRRFGLATIRYPVVEVTAQVTPFPGGMGCSLTVQSIRAPRRVAKNPPPPISP